MSLGGEAGPRVARFQFVHDGRRGSVRVTCAVEPDPGAVGTSGSAAGFPSCTASVDFDGRGYNSFFGWIQLVQSTDNQTGGREFEPDPLGWFPDSTSPYAFFGLLPTLFDAPSREQRRRISWVANSFLATTPPYGEQDLLSGQRRVIPTSGFSWGFDIEDNGVLALKPILPLQARDWNERLPVLRKSYSTWSFPEMTRFE